MPSLRRQSRVLINLLRLWPTVPDQVANAYVHDVLGCTMTRTCFQEAKQFLGVHKPEYAEKTLKKRDLAFLAICNTLLYNRGADDKEIRKAVRTALRGQFGESTQSRLIDGWIDEIRARTAEVQKYKRNMVAKLEAEAAELENIKEELAEMGIECGDDRQQGLGL